jgi:hypothetical protein
MEIGGRHASLAFRSNRASGHRIADHRACGGRHPLVCRLTSGSAVRWQGSFRSRSRAVPRTSLPTRFVGTTQSRIPRGGWSSQRPASSFQPSSQAWRFRCWTNRLTPIGFNWSGLATKQGCAVPVRVRSSESAASAAGRAWTELSVSLYVLFTSSVSVRRPERACPSAAELAEVMIDVEIAPAEPVATRHRSEDRVRRPAASNGPLRQLLDEPLDLGDVHREVTGAAAVD